MSIDWAAFGQVFGVSLVATVALVGIFTLGIVGVSARGGAEGGGTSVLSRTGAYACFVVCAAAVAYAISIIHA